MSDDTQSKAQALNHKLERAASSTIDELERQHLRPLAKAAYLGAAHCYDVTTNSSSSSAAQLEHCVRQAQLPFQQSNQLLQQEVNLFQSRLNHAMQECQNKARDRMLPGYEKDQRKMEKVEAELIHCMQKTVDEYIGLLKPMKERIVSQLKQLK